MSRLKEYARLMRVDRPIGTLLLLWPTLTGVWIAGRGHPSLKIVLIFVLGVIVIRAAGCVINDIADRYLDPHVMRTKNRPLAIKSVTTKEAVVLFLLLMLIAFLLVLLLNPLTIFLACLGALLTTIYPFSKRYVHWPQFVLATAFGAWPILVGYAAVQNHLPLEAWVFAIGFYFWQASYDTMYAMSDKEDDVKVGIKSAAIWFGRHVQRWIAVFQGAALIGWGVGAFLAGLFGWFFVGLLITLGLMLFEQTLIADYDRQKCFRAFIHNRWIGLALFIATLLSYYGQLL